MSATCRRCGLVIDPPAPQVGEVWLRVDTRLLYVITEEWGPHRIYGTAERLHPRGAQGCDPQWQSAVWHDAVNRGEWVKVEGMSAGPHKGKAENT